MKVGDLVKLSAYAARLKWCERLRDKVGIVLETVVTSGNMGYEILWSGEVKPSYMRIREVKFVK